MQPTRPFPPGPYIDDEEEYLSQAEDEETPFLHSHTAPSRTSTLTSTFNDSPCRSPSPKFTPPPPHSKPSPSSGSRRDHHRTRMKLYLIIFLFNLSFQILGPAQLKIFEEIFCAQYYESHPLPSSPSLSPSPSPSVSASTSISTLISASASLPTQLLISPPTTTIPHNTSLPTPIPEPLCKLPQIQSLISTLLSTLALLASLPTLLTALPIGLLSDTFGRQPFLRIQAVVILSQQLWTLTVTLFPHVFPLRAIWAAAALNFVSGGLVVAEMVFSVIITDITPRGELAGVFFKIGAVGAITSVLGPAIAGGLMHVSPWWAVGVGTVGLGLVGVLGWSVPETLGCGDVGDGEGEEDEEEEDEEREQIDSSRGGRWVGEDEEDGETKDLLLPTVRHDTEDTDLDPPRDKTRDTWTSSSASTTIILPPSTPPPPLSISVSEAALLKPTSSTSLKSFLSRLKPKPTTSTARVSPLLKTKQATTTALQSFLQLLRHPPLIALLCLTPLLALSSALSSLLPLYVSNRYLWTLSDTPFLLSLSGISVAVTLFFILPRLSSYLRRRQHSPNPSTTTSVYVSPASPDIRLNLTLLRTSLFILSLAYLTEALAPSVSLFILGLLLESLASGLPGTLRALASLLVKKGDVGRVYSLFALAQTGSTMLAYPGVAGLFNAGLRWSGGQEGTKGDWALGMGYLGTAIVGVLGMVGLGCVRFERKNSKARR